MPSLAHARTALVLASLMSTTLVQAAEHSPAITIDTQEVGLTAGCLLPHRLTVDHTTEQQGPALMPSWIMTLTNPMGDSWYRGQVSIGASMFLLTPIIELDYDYAAQARLELERWDGEVKRYEAGSSGTVRYNLFGASPIMIDELKGQATEACLDALMNQVVQDTNLYMASKTPMPASTIRTVTVGARRPAASTASLPAVLVSANPAP